jgi:hypothetical protein
MKEDFFISQSFDQNCSSSPHRTNPGGFLRLLSPLSPAWRVYNHVATLKILHRSVVARTRYSSKKKSNQMLPNELLYEIMEFLPNEDLRNMKLVSRNFFRLVTCIGKDKGPSYIQWTPKGWSTCTYRGCIKSFLSAKIPKTSSERVAGCFWPTLYMKRQYNLTDDDIFIDFTQRHGFWELFHSYIPHLNYYTVIRQRGKNGQFDLREVRNGKKKKFFKS